MQNAKGNKSRGTGEEGGGSYSVVIADDHSLTRDGIRGLLETMGNFEIVAEAANGLEAINVIKRTQPDLALLDLKMPYANGAEAFVEVRRWSPNTRVIVLTGLSSAAMFQELVEAGVHGLFLKSGEGETIRQALPKIMAGAQVVSDEVQGLINANSSKPSLTRRELQVLQAIARGETNTMIAERLGISPKTVDTHRTNLMAKLGVHSTAALLAHAMHEGLVETPNSG